MEPASWNRIPGAVQLRDHKNLLWDRQRSHDTPRVAEVYELGWLILIRLFECSFSPLFYKTWFAIHFANQLGNPKLTKFIYLLTLKFPRWNTKWNNDCWKALSLKEVSLSRVLRFSLEYLHSPLVLTLKLSVKNRFLVKNYHMRSPQSTETISAVYQTSFCQVIASADAPCNDGQTTLLEFTANSKS